MVFIKEDKIIINDHIENDPLSEENLDKTLETIHEIRLLFDGSKTIWLYTGYKFEDLMKYEYGMEYINNFNIDALRQCIISQCDVLVDGRYIDTQRDISLKWRGSSNQRVIDIQKSIKKNKLILYSN